MHDTYSASKAHDNQNSARALGDSKMEMQYGPPVVEKRAVCESNNQLLSPSLALSSLSGDFRYTAVAFTVLESSAEERVSHRCHELIRPEGGIRQSCCYNRLRSRFIWIENTKMWLASE